MKTCTKCLEPKSLDSFKDDLKYKDGKFSWCKLCANLATSEWKLKNKERQANYNRFWKTNKKYGINEEAYNKMLLAQSSVCKICKSTPEESPKGILFIDHCHETNKVRGLICDHCNNLLGRAKDSIPVLQEAIKYLEEHDNSNR